MINTGSPKSPKKNSRDKSAPIPRKHSHRLSQEFPSKVSPNATQKEEDLQKALSTVTETPNDAGEPLGVVYQNLDSFVTNLNRNIVDIVKKQNRGFLDQYKTELNARKMNLISLENQYEESISKVNKEQKYQELENEIQYFKDEAVRVTKLLHERDSHIKTLKSQVSNLKDENHVLANYLKYKVIDRHKSKAENEANFDDMNLFKPAKPRSGSVMGSREKSFREKQIFLTTVGGKELYKTLNNYNVFENENEQKNPRTKMEEVKHFIEELNQRSFQSKSAIIKQTQKFCSDLVDFYERKMKKVLERMNKERDSSPKTENRKIGETKDLLEFFNQCVNDVKRNITQRRTVSRGSMRSMLNKTTATAWTDVQDEFHNLGENFLLKDKQRVLEMFLTNPQVTDVFRYILFHIKEKNEMPFVFGENFLKNQRYSLPTEATPNYLTHLCNSRDSLFPEDSNIENMQPQDRKATLNQSHDFAIDFAKLQRIADNQLGSSIETDNPVIAQNVINLKFAQLNESRNIPPYKPRNRIQMKEVMNSYKLK